MQFSCTQENLFQGLQVVTHITGKNINLPVLGNVLIRADKSGIQFNTTNLEMTVCCTIRGKVDAEGEYSVPAKIFLDYVSLLPSGKVEFILKEEGLEVKANDQETILRGMPSSEFPLLPKLNKQNTYQLRALEVKRAIGRVVFAVSVSESRPELSGVACFFNPEGRLGKVAMVATDSYRLAEQLISCGDNTKVMTVIVPAKAMSEIMRIISSYKNEIEPPEHVAWSISDNQLVVSYGEVELTTRLIEASFPDYLNIIPTNFSTEAVLSRIETQKAVRTASLFARKEINDVHVSINPGDSSCVIESSDEGTGKTKSQVKGQMTGDKNKVVLNYKYLADGLNAFEGDHIKFAVTGSVSPMMLLPATEDDVYRYLVMPIRQ
jgi:DNA polymerase III subunit beta